jgi:hypothetical protein
MVSGTEMANSPVDGIYVSLKWADMSMGQLLWIQIGYSTHTSLYQEFFGHGSSFLIIVPKLANSDKHTLRYKNY